MRKIVYLAHPVRGDVEGNLANVRAWLRVLFKRYPTVVFIAPWYAEVVAWGEVQQATDKAILDKALDDDITIVCRCDGILLVGGEITKGMAIERAAALASQWKHVIDLSAVRAPTDATEEQLDSIGEALEEPQNTLGGPF